MAEKKISEIVVKVVEAEGLAPMDLCGTSDPYVILQTDFNKKIRIKTPVIMKTCNPQWNHTFKILLPNPKGKLTFKVWDQDKWSRDDFLGELTLLISEFADGQSWDIWRQLDNQPKNYTGKIHLTIKCTLEENSKSNLKQESLHQKYSLGPTLGEGGFAIVKKCTDKVTKENFALKIIDKKQLAEEDIVMLDREVEIMTKLKHPNLVSLVDVYDEPDAKYLVLELLEGGELFDQIIKRRCFPEKQSKDLVKQMLVAIEYMHQNGVAHRDLKPENILCADKNCKVIKLADFGLSKDFGIAALQTSCGSPGYVAPEILKNEAYDSSVDIWSIGVITYILLCGFQPFHDENPRALYDQVVNCRYTFPSPEWNHISKEAKTFIEKILVLNPSRRPSASELLHKDPWLNS